MTNVISEVPDGFFPAQRPRFLRHLKSRIVLKKGSAIGHSWARRPDDFAGRKICLFVTYTPGDAVSPHALQLARTWEASGYDVVLLINADDPASVNLSSGFESFAGILLRKNGGYDFGAWATALLSLDGLRDARSVTITNDSLYGPLGSFSGFLNRMEDAQADVVGATESLECGWHFQSYLMMFKAGALKTQAFWDFWRNVRAGDRRHAIDFYELQFVRRMRAAGLRCRAIFPVDPNAGSYNPTRETWRQLIDQGFPFVKAEIIRKNLIPPNTGDWATVVRDHGGDAGLIHADMALRGAV